MTDSNTNSYDEGVKDRESVEKQRDRSTRQKKRGALSKLAMMTLGKRYTSAMDVIDK
jgi:hypothetical protein